MTRGRPIRTPNNRHLTGEVVSAARRCLIDLNRPLHTLDGDEAIIFATDPGHPFPIIGEVHDYNSNASWLARWNTAGQYRGSPEAASKHSLYRNMDRSMQVLGEIMRKDFGKKDETRAIPPVNDPAEVEFDKTFEVAARARAVSDTPAPTRATPRTGPAKLGFVPFLKDHSPLLVAAVAVHVDRLVNTGRLTVPSGFDMTSVSFDIWREVVTVLNNEPEAKAVISTTTLDEIALTPEVLRGLRFGQFDAMPARSA